jgi:hypothetical protein
MNARFSGTIMDVGMTNSSSRDSDQDIIISGRRLRNITHFEAATGLNKANSFHQILTALRICSGTRRFHRSERAVTRRFTVARAMPVRHDQPFS